MERRRLLITIFLLAASCASAFARDGSVRAVVDILWKENDFITRNGHSSSYYSSYGYPNAIKFEMLEKTGLMSKNGQLWIKEVERNLQESLEILFILFGNSASIIEESYLKQLAFQTHPIAYMLDNELENDNNEEESEIKQN